MISKHISKFFHTFQNIFKSPKHISFLIKPLTHQNIEENSQELTKSFKYEPISQRYESEYLLKVFRKIAEKSLKQDLGITCYEESTGKWAGCMLSEDYSTTVSDPSMESDGKCDLIIDFMSFLEREGLKQISLSQAENRNEQIHILLAGVAKEMWGNKILYNMVRFFTQDHPIVKDSKLVFGECTNLNSRKACEEMGMKTVYSIKYSEMAKKEELKDYLKDYKEMLKRTNKSEDEVAAFNCLIRY